MRVACTACDHRFEAQGYRDQRCPACSAVVAPELFRPCPRCGVSTVVRNPAGVVIEECDRCKGELRTRPAIGRTRLGDRPQQPDVWLTVIAIAILVLSVVASLLRH